MSFTVLNIQDDAGILLTVILTLVFPSAFLTFVSLMKPIIGSILTPQSHPVRLVIT